MREYDTNMNDGYGECRECDRLERQIEAQRDIHNHQMRVMQAKTDLLLEALHHVASRGRGVLRKIAEEAIKKNKTA